MKRTTNYSLSLLVCIIVLLASCHRDNNPAPLSCDSSNTLFNQAYNDLVQLPVVVEDTFMDAQIHAYTFEVSAPATICKIGYRGMPQAATIPYQVEIYNNTTSTLVYSGSHVFSPAGTSYVAITPVALTAGNSYTVKRIYTGPGPLHNLLGRVARNMYGNDLSFPVTHGILTITGSSFYDVGEPYINEQHCLPYIDIVFE